jgi:hypothetical protein
VPETSTAAPVNEGTVLVIDDADAVVDEAALDNIVKFAHVKRVVLLL